MNLVSQIESLGGTLMDMAGSRVGLMIGDAMAEIAQQLDALRRRTQETGEDLRKMEQEQESFAISYHECTKLNAHLQNIATQPQTQQCIDIEKKIRRQKEQQEQHLNHKVTSLLQLRLTLADKLKDTISKLNLLQSRVLDNQLIRYAVTILISISVSFTFRPAFVPLIIPFECKGANVGNSLK
jgi:signal transducer and activator of transcription 5B